MKVHLVDGTYELFRHYYALPKHTNVYKEEVAAASGVVRSMFSLLSQDATHVAVATDHVIESFRNALWQDYKDGSGIASDLNSQFPLLEDALREAGFPVWAMVEHEADDALAAGASLAAKDERVDQVLICTPDKDLAQCVVEDRIVQFDRRHGRLINADAVRQKFGVVPESIPDFLALVGDSADGFPGIPGWGVKSAAAVLSKFIHIEAIPQSALQWRVDVRSAGQLAYTLTKHRETALLFRRLATLVQDVPVPHTVDDLEWKGPTPDFASICARLDAPDLLQRAHALHQKKAR